MPPFNILSISGSTRKNSVNNAILHHLQSTRSDLAITTEEGLTDLPYFNPDFSDPENLPAAVHDFITRIEKADGVIICTPEYVFSLPGILKNAIEWCVATTVFQDKPLGMIVASLAGQKAFESLDLVMTTVGARATPGTKLLISGAYSKLDKASHTLDKHTISLLDDWMNSFRDLLAAAPRP